METSQQISSDLKAVLAENHTKFELLNTYKGVPVICRSTLQKVEGQVATLHVRRPEMGALEKMKTTQILSDGLLEPIEAHILSFDRQTGLVELSRFVYAGSRLSNRKDLRVEPGGPVQVSLEWDQGDCTGWLVDISLRGAGIQVDPVEECTFGLNKTVTTSLRLPEGEARVSGRIRNIAHQNEKTRLAVEFTGAGDEKALVVRYILQRRAEIYEELHEIYAAFERPI